MSKKKHPFMSSIKKAEIKREVVFSITGLGNKLKREICSRFADINGNLLERLEQIARLSSLRPPRMNVCFGPNTSPYIEDTEEPEKKLIESENLRVILNFEKLNGEKLHFVMQERGVSHLVEISFCGENSNDLNGENISSSATLYLEKNVGKEVTARQSIKIVEDVMLDICMFHAVFDGHDVKKEDFRRIVSAKKVEWVNNNNGKSSVWNSKVHKGYVALAGYFWNNGRFDYPGYIDCWRSIRDKLLTLEQKDMVPSIETQLNRHIQKGELPKKRIIKEYAKLDPGVYILVKMNRIPANHKVRRSLLTLFGGKVLSRKKVRIFSVTEEQKLLRYREYLSLFKLLK